MHIVDMSLDYNVAIRYLLHGKITYFIWTICLILIPPLISVLVHKRILQQNKKNLADISDSCTIMRLITKNKLFFVIAISLQLAPVVHYWETLKYALKVYKCKKSGDHAGEIWYYSKMLKKYENAALLRVLECYLESAPQQILQLSIVLNIYDNEINLELHQVASVISSLVSMSWAMANYHRSIRLARKLNINIIGIILQFLCYFCITVARILSLSVIASIWPLYTIICYIIHWISMIIWISIDFKGILKLCQTYNLSSHMQPSIEERIYSVIFASVVDIVQIFTHLNTMDGSTFWKYLCYTVCFLENITLNLLWRYNCPPAVREAWYFNILFIICIVSFFLGIAAMLLYYTVFHPSRNRHTNVLIELA